MANTNTRLSALRVSRIHFFYGAALALQAIIYDAWKLVTPPVVLMRWLVAVMLIVATTLVWLAAKGKPQAQDVYRKLIMGLAFVDILVATFGVYTQRGMASRAVFLYVIPLVTVSILGTRRVILAFAALCVAAYTSAALAYFVLNFNEGYKIELYGEVGFYSVAIFIVAFLLWAVVRPKKGN